MQGPTAHLQWRVPARRAQPARLLSRSLWRRHGANHRAFFPPSIPPDGRQHSAGAPTDWMASQRPRARDRWPLLPLTCHTRPCACNASIVHSPYGVRSIKRTDAAYMRARHRRQGVQSCWAAARLCPAWVQASIVVGLPTSAGRYHYKCRGPRACRQSLRQTDGARFGRPARNEGEAGGLSRCDHVSHSWVILLHLRSCRAPPPSRSVYVSPPWSLALPRLQRSRELASYPPRDTASRVGTGLGRVIANGGRASSATQAKHDPRSARQRRWRCAKGAG